MTRRSAVCAERVVNEIGADEAGSARDEECAHESLCDSASKRPF